MSFTVQEARAAFFISIFALPRITLAAQKFKQCIAKTAAVPKVLATPAT